MRILALAVLAAVIFAPTAFAQQAAEEFSGKIDSIDRIDPARGDDDGSVIVIDDAGKAVIFRIDVKTAITDEASNKLTSDDIADGDSIKVSYSKTDEGNMALTILKLEK